ncbi:MAG: hypothetical protein E2598_07490 [Sphingobium sp.]|nr:hypothetical protein [Sphingobium sp.]
MSVVSLTIDQKQLDRDVALFITSVLSNCTKIVGGQTRELEKEFEAATQRGVKGRLYLAWASRVYPKGGKAAYAPAGEVYVNGRSRSKGTMIYWTQPGEQRKKGGGKYLAIPTPEAGVLPRNRNLTPEEWEHRTGSRLHFVPGKRGKAARLVARNVVYGANGKGTRKATQRRTNSARYANAAGGAVQAQEITIFVLVEVQRFANKVDLTPILARREKLLVEAFERRMMRMNRAGSGLFGSAPAQ